ncbi:FtsK/SpoIIIE domain-containing protein, partial [Demequina sp.]|uniref:FtsK/SpoIIIE domain-containing protein n=1 Tax=Demequina sp. TaxID=2050685 RepID=UPI0025F78487
VGLDALAGLPLPVAIVGESRMARGAARALALAQDAALGGALAEPWMRWCAGALPAGSVEVVEPGARPASEAATVIDVDAGAISIRGRRIPWRPAAVTPATAELAARRGASTGASDLPATVRWAELPQAPAAGPASSVRAPRRLIASIGVGQDGVVALDLDRDGPHVLVAGTTGSGKSALLETLTAALAHGLGPTHLGIGLIDLKGGAGIGACAALPHVRGLLTDLDASHARRALLGVAHELRERKRALAREGLASWREWEARGGATSPAPARLLLVVDEFQELGGLDPRFVPELARLAAQGRSLGVHLVLATQRPAGSVTPEIRANVGTVIALRTASPAESVDVLGDAAAAALAPDRPGRAIVATPSRRLTMQAALPLATPRAPVRPAGAAPPPGPSLAEATRIRWPETGAEPLWLPPLDPGAAPPPGGIGWVDLPAARARRPVRWDPHGGPCVVVGPRGSGRSTALAAIAAAAPGAVALPADPREAARTLELAASASIPALLIDDVERACASLESVLRGAEQALEAVARRVPVALACGPGWGARWAARAGLRLVLSGLDRVEQTLWGVPADLVSTSLVPGHAVAIGPGWTGECRIARAPHVDGPRLVEPLVCPPGLAPDAVGVTGDAARPLRLTGGVVVVGPPGRERAAAVATIASAGAAVDTSERLGTGAGIEVIVEPDAAHLRALGLRVPPGLADAEPGPGRVVIRSGSELAAGQLRPAPSPDTRSG